MENDALVNTMNDYDIISAERKGEDVLIEVQWHDWFVRSLNRAKGIKRTWYLINTTNPSIWLFKMGIDDRGRMGGEREVVGPKTKSRVITFMLQHPSSKCNVELDDVQARPSQKASVMGRIKGFLGIKS